MSDILQYEFMRNAIISVFLVSIACGVVGTFVVAKRISFIAGGIAHISFGGVGLGYFLGMNPVLVSIPFTIISAFGIGAVSRKANVNEDAAIGMLWAVGMALGVVLVYLTPGFAPDLFSYLFGNILTVPYGDLLIMAALDWVILLSVFVLYSKLRAVSFDEEFSEIMGLPSGALYFLLLVLVSLSVVVLMRAVGVILLLAFLIIPVSIARKFTHDLKWIMVFSAVIGVIFGLFGLAASYQLNLPSGATMVLGMGIAFFIISALENLKIGKEAHPRPAA